MTLGLPGRANACRGFTLVELMVVAALLSILALALLPMAELQSTRWKERELRHALWEMRGAIDEWKRLSDESGATRGTSASGYPPSLEALVQGWRGRPLLRRIPRDPFAAEGEAASQSWGLRSHASPAHAPQAGADVYDVFSRSERIGSDGIALREW